MKRPAGRLNAVGGVLSDVLKRIGPEHELRAYTIWTFWDDEVGDLIARRAQPARFRNGILFVTVASHSWMQELQFMKDVLRDKLNTRLGAPVVRDIFFISGSIDAPAAPTEDVAALDPPAAVTPIALPPIADAELAAAFARVAAAHAKCGGRTLRQSNPRPKRSR